MNYTIYGSYNGYECAFASTLTVIPIADCSLIDLSNSFRNCTVAQENTDVRLQSSSKIDCLSSDSAPAVFRKISPGNDVILAS
jgi:hypothetical protein